MVPREVWLGLFSSAKQEIDVLIVSEMPFAGDPAIMAALASGVHAGVRVRICLAGTHGLQAGPDDRSAGADTRPAPAGHTALRAPLPQIGGVHIREHQAATYHSIYRADDQLLISQHAYGIPPQQTPVLLLQHGGGAMASMYLAEFERIWAHSVPVR